jgi:hypothetical protein
LPAAVLWTYPSKREGAELSLPNGRIRASDCVFRGVGPAIACRTLGALAIEMVNCLHLGAGPLLQLDHCPRVDEPLAVGLTAVTLRGPGPLLEIGEGPDDPPGTISVQANACALTMAPRGALLSFIGSRSPQRLLSAVQWTGQDSLVSPEAMVARWVQPDGRDSSLDDAGVSIAGLVRSAVVFAGPAEDSPSASRLVEWQAPLRSSTPPGIDPRALTWPLPRTPNTQ